MTWLERWIQRQNDIAQGADADLFADNAKRFRWASLLAAACALLLWIGTKWLLPHAAHTALNIVAVVLAVASGVLFRWARAMDSVLHNPDPADPPSILKE